MQYRRNSDYDVQRARQVLLRHGFYDLPKTRARLREWVEHIDANVELVDEQTDYIEGYIEEYIEQSPDVEPLDVLLDLRTRISELSSDITIISSIQVALARDAEDRPLASVRRWKKWDRERTETLVGSRDDYEGSPLSIVDNSIRALVQE